MEDRVKKLEIITGRLMKRAYKKTTIIIPAIPISHVTSGENLSGSIFKYMFPCNGTVIKGLVKFDHKPKNAIFIDIRLSNELTSTSKGFTSDKRMVKSEIGVDVAEGDCLEVLMGSNDENIIEVWISFTFVPRIKDCAAKQIAIDSLEEQALEIEQSALLEDKSAGV